MSTVEEAKSLICELCADYYKQGWVSGTGGGMSIRAGDKIVMAPSGVPKERMLPSDMFVLDAGGTVLETPTARPPPYKPPKLSECSPLFMAAYELRGAGAVLHSHSLNAVAATLLDQGCSEFRATHLEMIKARRCLGIAGHGFYDTCVVPIIENTARECELTGRLREAIAAYPRSSAVLVRRHGMYVWGDNWLWAKGQAECYEYIFEAALRMRDLGIDAARPPPPPPLPSPVPPANGHANGHAERPVKKQRMSNGSAAAGVKLPGAIMLDIEGTVASISFVTEVLFPYAATRLRAHLEESYDSAETAADIDLLRQLGDADAAAGTADAVVIPPASLGKAAVVDAAVASVQAQMAADRKTTALKSLQGHIWAGGFARGELRSQLYADVPDALTVWRNLGIRTYIYSSGSRGAQRDLFRHTTVGDLRPYLCGFFDTTSGPKVEESSYREIGLALGQDSPADILFATDSVAEARAASGAGWRVVVADRPGNKPLPPDHGFRVVTSMHDVLA